MKTRFKEEVFREICVIGTVIDIFFSEKISSFFSLQKLIKIFFSNYLMWSQDEAASYRRKVSSELGEKDRELQELEEIKEKLITKYKQYKDQTTILQVST